MRPINLCIVLTSLVAAPPCAAQTGAILGNTAPEITQMPAQRLLAAGGSGHKDRTPQQRAYSAGVLAQFNDTERAGAEALRVGDFVAAEGDFRESLTTSPRRYSYFGLGAALAGQGRTAEAIEAYRAGIYKPHIIDVQNDISMHGQFSPNVRDCPGATDAEAWMKYALLLSQTGQGEEAVAIYKGALPRVPDAGALGLDASLASGTLTPVEFQAGTHMALGLCATFGGTDTQAMGEFGEALRLRPDSPLTNYYYGYGWRHLALKGRARATLAPQAKAAFQKAASLGEGDVKKNAEEALKAFAPPR